MAIPKRINSPFNNIPSFFRRDIYGQIFGLLEKTGSLQLVGLWGFGKSLTLRILESNQDEIKKTFKVDPDTLIFLSDLSLLADGSTNLVLKHIFAKMLGLDKMQSMSDINLSSEITNYFNNAHAEGKKIIIILDSLEKLTSYHNLEIFDFLHALYRQNIENLSFVFCFEHEVGSESVKEKFGLLGRLMFNHILHLTPLNSKEENWFFDSIVGMVPENKISDADKKLILSSAGGYMVSIKRLIEAAGTGENIAEIIENPSKLPGLAYSLDILLDGLGPEIETLKKLSVGKVDSSGPENLGVLKRHYLIDKNNHFLSKVLENYLRNKFGMRGYVYKENVGDLVIDAKLSASEYKILEFLNKNRGVLCGREDIIAYVWGTKADAGISDHALDQIVSRLRKKLAGGNSSLNIETLRGRGHRLI
jgi:hypothetical protein